VLGTAVLRLFGNRMSMCSPGAEESTLALPPRPWRAPERR
jgi:Na+:H+ antiporter, NhaA family